MGRNLARLLALGAVAVLAGATGATVSADPGENFHIVTTGPFQFAAFDAFCPNGFHISGANQPVSGTHIGVKATFGTDECAVPDFANNVNHVDGHAVVTTKQGDKLFIHYRADSPPPDLVTGNFHDDGTIVFEGGTGRFADATGSGTITSDGNLFAVSVTAHFDGRIEMH